MNPSDRTHPPSGHGLAPYVALVLLGTLPIVALGIYALRLSARAVDDQVEAENLSAARLTRKLVETEFEHRLRTLVGFAAQPGLVREVRARDEAAVRRCLESLVEAHPRIDRAFVTDPDALLWSDHPRAPESLGVTFDERDWYRGVSRAWEPYISRVYRRHAAPRPLLVATAVPVRDGPDGEVLGIVVYQMRLEGLTEVVREVEVGRAGHAFLVCASGSLAAHPHVDLQDREHPEYGDTPPVREAAGGRVVRGQAYDDPISGERMLASAVPCDVGGARWVVVAQQPLAVARGASATLVWQIGGAGVLLVLVVGGLCFGLARFHARARDLNRRLEGFNEELERRVEERTEELRQKEAELHHAQKLEAVGRMAGGLAHDFNNLLSVVLGYGDLLLEEMEEDDPHRDEIEAMRDAGERARTLTRQLLAFSRKQVLQPRVLDLNETVEDTLELLDRLLGEDIDIETALEPELDPVEVDPGQLEQVIVNLAVNARDAMPEGGRLTIETANVLFDEADARAHAETDPGPHVLFAVSDTGTGMEEETREHIFEPFFTTKGPAEGTGLGLATVYGIVKQTGGTIRLYSEPGHGTTFKIYLPAAEGEPTEEPSRRRKPLTRGTETTLLVEDDPEVRELIGAVLRRGGYAVVSAADAEEALARFEEHEGRDGRIRLLVTDVVLPGSDGLDLAERLRERRGDLGVIYVSGYTDRAISRSDLLAVDSAFVEKPIRPTVLLETAREVLDGDEEG